MTQYEKLHELEGAGVNMTAAIVPWSPYEERTSIVSSGRTPLTSAFADLVCCSAGFPPHELPDIFAAPEDEGDNDACRDLVRLDAEELARTFVIGSIDTFARPLGGGEIKPVDAALWEIDDPLPRFATGALNLKCWADQDAPLTHRLFVASKQFDSWLAALKPHGALTARQVEAIVDPQVRAARSVAARALNTAREQSPGTSATTSMPTTPVGAGPEMLTIEQVSEMIGLARSTIHKRVAEDKFPEQVKSDYASRWLKSEVMAWIAE